MNLTTERVPFRLIMMPCCHHLFCNVNHRFPSFCPNCGEHIFPKVREGVLIYDEEAILKYNPDKKP